MHAMKAIGLSFVLLVALLAGGCKAGGESAVVGKWKGQIKMDESKKDDPAAKMAEAFASMLTMDVEMKSDHSFKLTVMMMPIEGSWSMSGSKVSLTPKTIAGLSPEEYQKQQAKSGGSLSKTSSGDFDKPLNLELQPDGKTMKMVKDGAAPSGGGDFVFTKEN